MGVLENNVVVLDVQQMEVWLEGRAVVPGIAIGSSFALPDTNEKILQQCETVFFESAGFVESVELEIERFHGALKKSENELCELCEKLRLDGFCQEADLVETHLHMVNDPALIEEVVLAIREKGFRAESIIRVILERYRAHFEMLPETLFRQRFEDVESVFLRILSFLIPESDEKIELPGQAIVFANMVTAPVVAEVTMRDIGAIVTQRGGAMSHTAIVAKARGIPYVTNISLNGIAEFSNECNVIVDGLAGLVVLNPEIETVRRYTELKEKHDQYVNDSAKGRRGETKDGCKISLLANIANPHEANVLSKYGLDGIGLYRTEYQVLEKGRFPSEDEQAKNYADVVKAAEGKLVVIRVFDFGSDKGWKEAEGMLPEVEFGGRSMEMLLKRPQTLCAQLRALVRSSAHGPVSLLFPMVSSVEELENCLQVLHRAWTMVSKDWALSCPKVGVMVELPSLAFRIRDLAGKVDFISVGTNDLIQFALAVDRSASASFDPKLAFHPGFLNLLKYIVNETRAVSIPLRLCGEIASDPVLIPFLVGLGIREFSFAPRLTHIVKHVLHSFTVDEAECLADTVLSMNSAHEIYSYLSGQYRKFQFGS